jgi:hypothetical protein
MANLQELQDLEDLEVEKVEEPAPKPLQKLKIKKGEKPVTEDAVQNEEPVKKTRKPKTEKQLEVFARAREKMLLNLKERKEKQALEEMQLKKELEEKIVQKAISIKKKQIKKKAVLDIVSDDDTPIEEVKKLAMKVKPKVIELPPPPQSLFEKYKFI